MSTSQAPHDRLERALWAEGYPLVAGVDEVGRGPLAGPVVAAAVILDPLRPIAGLNDSKKLTARLREALAGEIHDRALAVGLAAQPPEEIDRLNILQAALAAMAQAVAGLSVRPSYVLVDGNRLPPGLACPARAVVKGDATCLSIAAASIVAKVARDRTMAELARHYPGYGWERNAGYPTPEHLQALATLGLTPHHRRTFAPIRGGNFT